MENSLKWLKYIVREKDGEVEGIYKTSSDFPTLDPKTVASWCRCKNKTPDSNGFVYYRLGDYERSKVISFLENHQPINIPSLPDNQLNIVLTIGTKIVSVNDLYKARLVYKGGRPMATIYKNPKAVKVCDEIYRQLGHIDFSPYVDWLLSTTKYKVTISFVVKSGISRRDVENLSKSIIDTVVRHIRFTVGVKHFDDSEFLEISSTKSIIPGSKHEYAMINFTESDHNIRFDYIPTPNYIFLGGRWFEEWKDNIIPAIESKGLRWYAPELNYDNPEEWMIKRWRECNTYLEIVDFSGKDIIKEFSRIKELVDEYKRDSNLDHFLILGLKNFPLSTSENYLLQEYQQLLSPIDPRITVKNIINDRDLFS